MPAMLRNLIRFGLTALLLAAVAVSAHAREPKEKETLEKIHKQLRDIQAQLDLIKPEATSLKLQLAENEIKALKRRVEEMETHVRAPSSGERIAAEYSPPAPDAELRELRRRIDELDARLRALESADRARIARSFNPDAPGTPTGTILLQNRTTRSATIVVDGTSYHLAPLQTAAIQSRPLGPVTYEVHAEGWGMIRPPTTTRLASADRPLTIFVGP
jgi:hypothetical protein